MADDKSKKDGRDDSKIDANDASEVTYAAEQFGVEAADVREAISAVGNLRVDVQRYLLNR